MNAIKKVLKKILKSSSYSFTLSILMIFSMLRLLQIIVENGNIPENIKVVVVLILNIILILIIVIFFLVEVIKSVREVRGKIEKIKIQEYSNIRKETEEVLKDEKKSYSDKLLEMNYKYLDQYYYQIKIHADRSFVLSSIASIIGLMFLCIGIWFMFIDKIGIAYVTSSGGIIIEFIAGIFFYLYNKTNSKMYQYHQKLLISQNISTSIKLMEEVDEKSKIEMTKLIIERLTSNVNEFLAKEDQKIEK